MSSGLTQAAQFKDEALLQQRLFEWLSQDHLRLTLLAQVAECAALHPMPQWCIAAGFVRNLVWDRLHGLAPMPLADIDVIYYCPQDV
ncbi:MAG: nucleotidyltransferase family protein, partial [Shewanella sp.]